MFAPNATARQPLLEALGSHDRASDAHDHRSGREPTRAARCRTDSDPHLLRVYCPGEQRAANGRRHLAPPFASDPPLAGGGDGIIRSLRPRAARKQDPDHVYVHAETRRGYSARIGSRGRAMQRVTGSRPHSDMGTKEARCARSRATRNCGMSTAKGGTAYTLSCIGALCRSSKRSAIPEHTTQRVAASHMCDTEGATPTKAPSSALAI